MTKNPMSKMVLNLEFRYWDLFGIWYFEFRICPGDCFVAPIYRDSPDDITKPETAS